MKKPPEKLDSYVRKNLNNKQIIDHFSQCPKEFVHLFSTFPEAANPDDYADYLAKKRQKLERYPRDTIEALRRTLAVFAPPDDWMRIKLITAHINKLLILEGKSKRKKHNERYVSGILSAIGLTKRKHGRDGNYVYISNDKLKRYSDTIGKHTCAEESIAEASRKENNKDTTVH